MRNSTPDFAGMDPGQAVLIGWTEQLHRKAQAYRGLQREISQLTVTETSADSAVRITIDAQGVPTELTLTDRARGLDPARLSAELMTCLRRAHSTLAAQVQDLVAGSALDGGDDGADGIIASYRDRFADLPENVGLPADSAPRHARRLHPPNNEDDIGPQSSRH
jgi:YbaB/EbfC DNA-binding family